jgi:hypothetical protein
MRTISAPHPKVQRNVAHTFWTDDIPVPEERECDIIERTGSLCVIRDRETGVEFFRCRNEIE